MPIVTLKDYLDSLGDQPSVIAASFAERIGVSRQSVERYRDGARIPRPEHMEKIRKASHGKVMPGDFYTSRPPRRQSHPA